MTRQEKKKIADPKIVTDAVKEYKEAMEENLVSPLREIVSCQYSEVKRAHDRIRNLRDLAKAS